ncbi:MAG: TonB-dependent receptor plug domain-containing protein [Verrucomicrobiota bacterium]
MNKLKLCGVTAITSILTLLNPVAGFAQETSESNVETDSEVIVKGERESFPPIKSPSEGKIYAGKTATFTELDTLPEIADNDVRKIFSRTPGVYVSEMGDPSIVNLTLRGIGEPHETQDVLVLEDGIPIQSTLFGYPTLYYLPATPAIERVEVFKGGSSLLYGPQPAGAINFVTYDPPADTPFTAETINLFGSEGFVSTYNSIAGTQGDFDYSAWFHHRQADGFRDSNNDYSVFNGNIKLGWRLSDSTKLKFSYTGYDSETGEPGRLSYAEWLADDTQVTTPNNRLFIRKHFGSVTLDHEISDSTRVVSKTFAHYQQRLSRRGTSNTTVDDRLFRSIGNDTRFMHEYEVTDNIDSTFTGGFTVYHSDDPTRRNRVGFVTTATEGLPALQHQKRETTYGAVFAENLFEIGDFRVVPSARLDFVSYYLETNHGTGAIIGNDTEQFDFEPLFGIGFEYDLPYENTTYFNFAQGYAPLQYGQLQSRGGAAKPETRPGNTFTYELGVRGQPASWIVYDASLFYIDFQDFVDSNDSGTGDPIFSDPGDAEFMGMDLAVTINMTNLIDVLADSSIEDTIGTFELFYASEFLQAEFVSGVLDGNEPSYAPDYSIKFGPSYRHESGAKVDLTGYYVGSSYWDAANERDDDVGIAKIPAYCVWDLNFEVPVYKDNFNLLFGVNNLFDEKYFARIRGDGIQPINGRNFYGGFSAKF